MDTVKNMPKSEERIRTISELKSLFRKVEIYNTNDIPRAAYKLDCLLTEEEFNTVFDGV